MSPAKELPWHNPKFKPMELMSNEELQQEYDRTYEILTRECISEFDKWKLNYILELERLITQREGF